MEADLTFWDFSQHIVLPRLWEGLQLTLELTLWSGFCGILLGLGIAFARISRNPLLAQTARAYIALFRGTPLLLQILFIYFALPNLMDIRLDAMPSGIIALSLNAAAYLAEIFRAGILSIDKGQWEAASALGMNYSLTMRRIILPQTVRRLLPPVVNELAALTKDTSLVSVIALSEMLFVTQRLAAKYLRPWEVFFWTGAGYLLMVLALSSVAAYLERRLGRREAL